AYLTPLGFEVAPTGSGMAEVVVPSWRPDTHREIDVIEEVARHHGYGSIPRTRPTSPRVGGLSPHQRGRRAVRAALVGLGVSEAWTSSMVSPEDHQAVGLAGPAIEIENPLAREESVLRATLLPGLLKALAANAARGEEDVALFEVGNVFAPPGPGQALADERERVALALGREGDDARRAVVAWRALADTLRLARVELLAAAPPGLHPTRSARVVAGEADLGVVGEVDPAVAAAFGLPGRRVGWVELDLGGLLGAPRRPEAAAPVSRFPAGTFDLAFVVEDGVPAGRVQATLEAAAGELLEAVWLFDVYRGPQLGPGRRSLAYRLRLAALDHTLTDEELGSVRARCVAAVASAHGAELRG
ncbi:MAG TPA: hypothetical protein VE152_04435, partial [Acidimicrobiales bacterium]|nr:hypothetical protein [Acidimicrobiales bacterium]